MSAEAAAKKKPEAKRGAIRDQGYQRYEGRYTPDRGRWALIAGRMLKMTARQPWVMVMLILAIFPALAAGVSLWFNARLLGSAIEAMKAAGMPMPSLDRFVYALLGGWKVSLLLSLLTAMFAGGGAVADDVRGGAFQFYFARPVTREQYLTGKLLPPVALVACVSMAPSVLLAVLRIAMAKDGADALASAFLPLQGLGFGAVLAIALGVPSVALSSLSRGRGYVQGMYAGVFLLPWILGSIFVDVTRSPWPAILSVPTHLDNLGRFVFRLPVEDSSHVMPVWLSAAFLAALITGSIALLRRRLASVEVVGS
jgi:hypothetical protein